MHEPDSDTHIRDGIHYFHIFRHNAKSKIDNLKIKLQNKYKILIYKYFSANTFYKLFVKGSYDTEVAFIEGYATRIISGSTNPNSQKIAWLHIDMFANHWSSIAFKNDKEEENAYHRFNRIVGVSQSVAASINRLFPNIPKADVIYNPIDEADILFKSKEYRPNTNKNNSFKLISVGRLVNQKGYDRLIPIIGELNKNGYNIDLYIVGEGSDRAKLEQQTSELGLDDKVTFIGYKNNPYPYFLACDAFVCSSRSEGFSTVVTEALILGLPVVATDCAGMKELLGENSEYGIITENNSEALKQGIIKLIEPTTFDHYKNMAQKRGTDFKLEYLIKEVEKCL